MLILILNVLLKEKKKYIAAVLSVQLLVFTLATVRKIPRVLCLSFN